VSLLAAIRAAAADGPPHGLAEGEWRGIASLAIYSPCRAYRYALAREWGDGPAWLFALLNPSKASEREGDPTIDRQVARARQAGAGALVVNAAALRETDRRAMLRHEDPVGPDNEAWIARLARLGATVVLGYGADAARFGGDRLLASALAGRACHALAINGDGSPRHPLYLRADAVLRSYGASICEAC
jgi:hypothetical protein